MSKLTIDRDYLVTTLADMVRINSINPALVPGGAGEAELAQYLASRMGDLSLEVETQELEPGRVNAIGRRKGSGGGRSLMLNGHIDTVGIEGMTDPFSADIRDGKLYGRGAYDMKASLAASLAAVKSLNDNDVALAGDLLLAMVVDEEYGSIGTADVAERYEVDGAIVTEPTALDLCLAHRGFLWLEVETAGHAAHGSRYQEGIDANMHMGRFLGELDKLGQTLLARTGHPLLGPPSLHAPIITGGSALSIYAAHCTLKIERRTLPGETEAGIVGEIQSIIDRLAAADPAFKATVRPIFGRDPYEVSADAPIARIVTQAVQSVRGQPPAALGAPWWMDSALLGAAGVETVIIGPDGAGAHADVEWVDLDSTVDLAQILANAAITYCGVG